MGLSTKFENCLPGRTMTWWPSRLKCRSGIASMVVGYGASAGRVGEPFAIGGVASG
jgi:hypothetical protein